MATAERVAERVVIAAVSCDAAVARYLETVVASLRGVSGAGGVGVRHRIWGMTLGC